MVALTSFSVDLALGGAYYDAVLAHSPPGFWLLNEMLSGTGARDSSGFTRHGTYTGTIGPPNSPDGAGPFPHGGTAPYSSASGYVSMGDVAAFEFTTAFSVECMVRYSVMGVDRYFVSKRFVAGGGWALLATNGGTAGRIQFIADTAGMVGDIFNVFTTSAYNDGLWHHVVATWDGTTGANKAKIYVDGALAGQGTVSAGTIATNAALFLLYAYDNAGTPTASLNGYLAGVAVYNGALSALQVGIHTATVTWTDVGDDLLDVLSLEYGTSGKGPLDRLAGTGTLDFTLDNSVFNSALSTGYYSPLHSNCRAGFTFNIPVRVRMTFSGTTYTKFWGRIAVIDPVPGQDGSRQTHCTAHDYMYLLADADVRSVDPQLGKTELDLIMTIFEALDWNLQPMALLYDAAVDTYAYAFDDLKGGVKAASALQKILVSAWGRGFVRGDGTFLYSNRLATTNQVIDIDLDDTELLELEVPSDRGDVFDHVRAITHPKSIDAAATSNLFVHSGVPIVQPAGGVVELWGTYRNPDNDQMTVGGTDMVTPLSGTDFVANAAADGSGADLTASVTVTAEFFASTVKLTLTNNHATVPAYFTTLKVRGKGIYDLSPVTSEAVGDPGNRPITVDLAYQQDESIGQEIADYILNEREVITEPVERMTIDPHPTSALMTFALSSEPSTLVTVSETQTGLTQAQAAIRSVRLELMKGEILTAHFGLTPIVVGYQWILGDPNFSALGETTVFG